MFFGQFIQTFFIIQMQVLTRESEEKILFVLRAPPTCVTNCWVGHHWPNSSSSYDSYTCYSFRTLIVYSLIYIHAICIVYHCVYHWIGTSNHPFKHSLISLWMNYRFIANPSLVCNVWRDCILKGIPLMLHSKQCVGINKYYQITK